MIVIINDAGVKIDSLSYPSLEDESAEEPSHVMSTVSLFSELSLLESFIHVCPGYANTSHRVKYYR